MRAKSKYTLTALALASMTLCGTAFSQSSDPAPATDMQTAAPQVQNDDTSPQGTVDQQKSTQILASTLIGMQVKNGMGDDAENIGKITDLVLEQGEQTVNVLVGVGGFLGIGAKDVGVPLDKVQFNPDAKTAVVNMSKEQLEEAPAYTTLKQQEAQEKQAEQQAKMQQQSSSPTLPAAGGGAAAQ